jgi:alpha-D-xyloside xylohydrolase
LAAGLVGGRELEAQPARQSGWVVVAPGIWKATVGTPEAVTPVRTRAVKMAREALEAMGEAKAPINTPAMTVDARGVKVRIPLAAEEQIYGFGLQFLSLQQRGKKRVTRVNADPKFDTGDSHAPVPFYVTSLGYGVFVDSARYVTFYCGESRRKPEGISDPRATHNLADEDTSEVIAEVPNCQGVEVYLFAGPTMLEAVRRYNLFSGGGCVPPDWGWVSGTGPRAMPMPSR